MSKLDRQLDAIVGGERVEIRWPKEAEIDIDALTAELKSNIDNAAQRVSLDLRGVHGAPARLVDLLCEAQVYARENGKVLAISAALPAMETALNPRRRRKAGRSKEAIDKESALDAGELAKSVLDSRFDQPEYDMSKAETIIRPKKIKKKTPLTHYIGLAGIIAVSLAVIGGVYYYATNDEAPLIQPPTKAYEDSGKVVLARKWVDKTGRFSVTGTFDRVEGEEVVIIMDQGEEKFIALELLSELDQKYVDRFLTTESPFKSK